jgi:hypothetical protein
VLTLAHRGSGRFTVFRQAPETTTSVRSKSLTYEPRRWTTPMVAYSMSAYGPGIPDSPVSRIVRTGWLRGVTHKFGESSHTLHRADPTFLQFTDCSLN